MRKRTQKGFTLVELVVVIVILGILAAVALPRFVGLQGDARYAKLQEVTGAMKAASAMAHAAYLVAQAANTTPGTPVASVTIEGTAVALTNGYPSIAGIGVAANLSEIDGITIVASASPVTVTVNGGPATCKVEYAAAASLGVAPVITLPTASVAAC